MSSTIEQRQKAGFGGGMNPPTGFPVYFTEVSERLGRYETTARDAAAISSRFGPATHRSVIDICCGIGRVSAALMELGHDVIALDLSPDQIEVAKRKNPGPNYMVGDMASLPAYSYDLMLNLYTSFGYFSTETEDLALLAHWYGALRPGGVLVMELADMDRARNRIPPGGTLVRETNGVTELLHMDWPTRLLTVEYQYLGHSWECVTRLYGKEDLQAALADAGFASVELYGSFDLTPKKIDDNLIIVATK